MYNYKSRKIFADYISCLMLPVIEKDIFDNINILVGEEGLNDCVIRYELTLEGNKIILTNNETKTVVARYNDFINTDIFKYLKVFKKAEIFIIDNISYVGAIIKTV